MMINRNRLRQMTDKELKEILAKHKLWLESKNGGERADLRGAYLRGADLRGTDLRNAFISGAYLSSVNLRGADLRGVDLCATNLCAANLRDVDLRAADLRDVDLRDADLCGADLFGANLRDADLYRVGLCAAVLFGANLRGAKNVPYIPMVCPDTGAFTAWKKAHGHIIKLLVPDDANRSSATSRKCRCSKAQVIAIETIDGQSAEITEIASDYDENFIYRVGETVSVSDFCEDRFAECAAGIHFFINRQEAVEYN